MTTPVKTLSSITDTSSDSVEVPEEFLCPLTLEIMKDPVITRHLKNFERSAILEWLARGNDHCPLSRQPLSMRDIITDHNMRRRIQKWQRENEQDIYVIGTSDCADIMGYFTLKEEDNTERTYEGDEEDELHEVRGHHHHRHPRNQERRQRRGGLLRAIFHRR